MLSGRRGRGTSLTPGNRFERLDLDLEPGEELSGYEKTEVFIDDTKSIITQNDSPDVGMERSLNPYRGCEHGCIYCYARPFHEYLGLNAGLDFETKIFAKPRAAELLRREIAEPGYQPIPLALSGITDPYQPIERRLRITRSCLKVLRQAGHPVCIITKGSLVARDIDLLAPLASQRAAWVAVSITTLDAKLARELEPRTPTPEARLDAIRQLSAAGIPVNLNVAPLIPGLTDHELPAIMEAAKEAGAQRATYIIVRLPHGVSDLFAHWLSENRPLNRNRVLNSIREMRGGRLNDPRFGKRMRGEGPKAKQIHQLFEITCRKLGWRREPFDWNLDAFRPPKIGQLDLFS